MAQLLRKHSHCASTSVSGHCTVRHTAGTKPQLSRKLCLLTKTQANLLSNLLKLVHIMMPNLCPSTTPGPGQSSLVPATLSSEQKGHFHMLSLRQTACKVIPTESNKTQRHPSKKLRFISGCAMVSTGLPHLSCPSQAKASLPVPGLRASAVASAELSSVQQTADGFEPAATKPTSLCFLYF